MVLSLWYLIFNSLGYLDTPKGSPLGYLVHYKSDIKAKSLIIYTSLQRCNCASSGREPVSHYPFHHQHERHQPDPETSARDRDCH